MTATILRGDARRLPLADASVDLVVTSPPYFALRAYTDGGEAYDGQIGAEATPQEYIAALVECTREWMRVLKPSGSCWVNLGDKFAQSTERSRNGEGARQTIQPGGLTGAKSYLGGTVQMPRRDNGRVRNKSLLLLPERYRIACVDELGLIARAVVIWSKPNGLPESVTDRVRRSHEDWVHLTRQPRYFSAVDEIREEHHPESLRHQRQARERGRAAHRTAPGQTDQRGMADGLRELNALGKLPGSVWEIATEPLTVPEHLGVDHFAAFPTEWPRRIILGWSPSGICVECGEGRRPVVDRGAAFPKQTLAHRVSGVSIDARNDRDGQKLRGVSGQEFNRWRAANPDVITGEACACPDAAASTRPAVVLDPFGGTGTTALVAKALGRHGISVDRSADYCRLAEWRTNDPGELAKAMRVEKPAKQLDGQSDIFDELGVA